ncbi:VOC family protein [Lyngbya aestuarii]|uniref:VOC family protein n=1 Tax=Lyngbya aestuarii TaxID=118322 RepID=UPI00403E2D08
MNPVLFHLAFPVTDIEQAKEYYGNGLGCEIGRESRNAVILNLYGNQLVAHLTQETITPQRGIYPRHFGLVFTAEADWEAMLSHVQQKQLTFYQEPRLRFPDEITEHRTFFLQDPFSNLMEFKFYRHTEAIFGSRESAAVGDRA